jgi:peptidyl-dipeptidase Dcp
LNLPPARAQVRETVAGEDRLVAVFIHDNYARQFKSSGAWMSEYRGQTKVGVL